MFAPNYQAGRREASIKRRTSYINCSFQLYKTQYAVCWYKKLN